MAQKIQLLNEDFDIAQFLVKLSGIFLPKAIYPGNFSLGA
jgi:hypothetical protein